MDSQFHQKHKFVKPDTILILLFLLLAIAARAAEPPDSLPEALAPVAAVPAPLAREVREAEGRMAATETGRRLLSSTAGVRFLADRRLERPYVARYRRGPPRGVFLNNESAAGVPSVEFELALVRELARAEADLPVPLIEGEQAAYQTELEYAVEKASTSAEFNELLRKAYLAADEQLRSRRKTLSWAEAAGEPPGLGPDLATPAGPFERLGLYLLLFSEDPDEFYWAVERDRVREPGAVPLAVLADFAAARAEGLSKARCGPRARYCKVDGRAFPPALVRAALAVREAGGIAKVGEAVGLFRAEGAKALRVRVNAWIREGR